MKKTIKNLILTSLFSLMSLIANTQTVMYDSHGGTPASFFFDHGWWGMSENDSNFVYVSNSDITFEVNSVLPSDHQFEIHRVFSGNESFSGYYDFKIDIYFENVTSVFEISAVKGGGTNYLTTPYLVPLGSSIFTINNIHDLHTAYAAIELVIEFNIDTQIGAWISRIVVSRNGSMPGKKKPRVWVLNDNTSSMISVNSENGIIRAKVATLQGEIVKELNANENASFIDTKEFDKTYHVIYVSNEEEAINEMIKVD